MEQKGLLLVVSGPSGCGKGTIMKELLAEQETIFLSVSATTRAPRPGEEHGRHYYFMSMEQFQKELDEDGILEHTCYCGNCYGTPKKPVLERCERGEDVILEIEVQGAMQVREKYEKVVTIFVMPPSLEELERRLVDRNTEDMETIRRRLETAMGEMRYARDYDYIVVNNTVDEAVKDIVSIIRAEKCSTRRCAEFLNSVIK